MIKLVPILYLFFIGCDTDWLESEKNDFMIRCNNKSIWPSNDYDNEEIKIFCLCAVNELSKSSLSYSQFLSLKKSDYNNVLSEINTVLNSCVGN